MEPFRTTRPFKEIRSSPIQIRPPRPRRLPHTRRPRFCRRMSSRQPPPAKSSPAPHRRRPRYWATAEQLLSDRPTKPISSAAMTRICMLGGEGANIFTFLAISDSTASAHDTITNFDPAKDVIDLSRIDANITTPGLQHFTFIGTAPFSGTGAQVRYQLNPATDQTYVEADLAGDSGNYYARFRNRARGAPPSHRRQLCPDGGSVGHRHGKWGCAYRNQGSNADRRDDANTRITTSTARAILPMYPSRSPTTALPWSGRKT